MANAGFARMSNILNLHVYEFCWRSLEKLLYIFAYSKFSFYSSRTTVRSSSVFPNLGFLRSSTFITYQPNKFKYKSSTTPVHETSFQKKPSIVDRDREKEMRIEKRNLIDCCRGKVVEKKIEREKRKEEAAEETK